MTSDDWWKLGWTTLNVLVSGGAAFGGAIYAQRNASARDESKRAQDLAYLASVLTAPLETYVQGCISVGYDDGTSEGRPAGDDGYHQATADTPVFVPRLIEVNWHALPADLMYDILAIPTRQQAIENYLSSEAFHDPPDFAEFFWERGYKYAKLGQQVTSIAARLLAPTEI
jgi:hypothetical protein